MNNNYKNCISRYFLTFENSFDKNNIEIIDDIDENNILYDTYQQAENAYNLYSNMIKKLSSLFMINHNNNPTELQVCLFIEHYKKVGYIIYEGLKQMFSCKLDKNKMVIKCVSVTKNKNLS